MKKKTHKGQCHSLPWAFKLYAEELGAKESGDRYMNHSYPTWNRMEQLSPNILRDSSQNMHIFAEIKNGKMGREFGYEY